jgi:hypothetical protein
VAFGKAKILLAGVLEKHSKSASIAVLLLAIGVLGHFVGIELFQTAFAELPSVSKIHVQLSVIPSQQPPTGNSYYRAMTESLAVAASHASGSAANLPSSYHRSMSESLSVTAAQGKAPNSYSRSMSEQASLTTGMPPSTPAAQPARAVAAPYSGSSNQRIDERISFRNLAGGKFDPPSRNVEGGNSLHSPDSPMSSSEMSASDARILTQNTASIDSGDAETGDRSSNIARILAANAAVEQYQASYSTANFVFSYQGLALIAISMGRSGAAKKLVRFSNIKILIALYNSSPGRASMHTRVLVILVVLFSVAAVASPGGPILGQAAGDTNKAAIAYRSNTGTDGLDAPKYREWNVGTGAWGSELELTTTSESAVRIAWLEFSPVSSKRVMIALHDDGTLDSFMCEGGCISETSWTKQQNMVDIWTAVPAGSDRPFDMAFEDSSGDLILVYDKVSTTSGQELFLRVMADSGTTFGPETAINTQTADSGTDRVYPFVRLAADDGNDKIGAVMFDTSNDDVNAMIWDGSVWGNNVAVTTASAGVDEEQIGIAWERNSGHLLAVGGTGANIGYVEYTTSWQTASTIGGVATGVGNVNWISMKQSPRSAGNEIYLAFTGDVSDFASIQWSGTAWGTGTEHDVNIDSHAARAFDIAISGDADGDSSAVDALLSWGHSTAAPALDVASVSAAGTGSLSWTHTPVGTPRAVIVFVIQNAAGTDQVTGVTYGGTTMTEVNGSPNLHAAGETGAVYAYFLGSSISSGAQTVTVNVSGAASKRAIAYTLTANDDTEIVDSDGTIMSNSLANPSVLLSLAGRTSWVGIGFHSGQDAITGTTPLGSWTDLEHDFGSQVGASYRFNTIGTSDVTAGWTQTADDAVMIGVAVSEKQGIMYKTWTASNTYGSTSTLSKANTDPWIQFAGRPNPTTGDTVDNLGGTLDSTFDVSRLQWNGGSNSPTNTEDEVTTDTTVLTYESFKVAFQRQPAKRTMNEQLGVTESVSRSATLSRSMSEQLAVTESVSRSATLSRSMSEQLAVTESVSRSATLSRSMSEQLGVLDAIASSTTFLRSISEQLAVTESVSRSTTLLRPMSEQLSLSGYITGIADMPLAEHLGLADALATNVLQSRSVSDQAGLSDTIMISRSTSTSELMSVTDTVATSVIITKTLSDNLSVIDSVSGSSTVFILIIDPMAIGESFSDISMLFHLDLSEPLVLVHSFATNFFASFSQGDSEGIIIEDSVVLTLQPMGQTLSRNIAESMGFEDSLLMLAIIPPPLPPAEIAVMPNLIMTETDDLDQYEGLTEPTKAVEVDGIWNVDSLDAQGLKSLVDGIGMPIYDVDLEAASDDVSDLTMILPTFEVEMNIGGQASDDAMFLTPTLSNLPAGMQVMIPIDVGGSMGGVGNLDALGNMTLSLIPAVSASNFTMMIVLLNNSPDDNADNLPDDTATFYIDISVHGNFNGATPFDEAYFEESPQITFTIAEEWAQEQTVKRDSNNVPIVGLFLLEESTGEWIDLTQDIGRPLTAVNNSYTYTAKLAHFSTFVVTASSSTISNGNGGGSNSGGSNSGRTFTRLLSESLFVNSAATIAVPLGSEGKIVMKDITDSLTLRAIQSHPVHKRVVTIDDVTLAISIVDVRSVSFGTAAATLNFEITNKGSNPDVLMLRVGYTDSAGARMEYEVEQTINVGAGQLITKEVKIPFSSPGLYNIMVEVISKDGIMSSTDIAVNVPWLTVYLYILIVIATVVVAASIAYVIRAMRRSASFIIGGK